MRRGAILLPALALLLMAAAEPAPKAAAQKAADPPTAEQETEHVVKDGETLMGIAARAKVPRVLIAEANGLKEPYVVRSGQKLKIQRTRRHTVTAGDTGFGVSYQYAVPWKDIAVANGLDADAALRPGTTLLIPTIIRTPVAAASAPPGSSSAGSSSAGTGPKPAANRFAWPVAGPVRRGFTARGQANFHDGLDITVPIGTAVRASAAGKVLFAGEEKKQFGKVVVIDHGDGMQTAYGFLSKVTVAKGDDVSKGERVGLSGRTGQAKGPELHFEIRDNSEPTDPAGQLPARP